MILVINSKLFWFGAGLAVYWGVQHFTGWGKSGARGPYNG